MLHYQIVNSLITETDRVPGNKDLVFESSGFWDNFFNKWLDFS